MKQVIKEILLLCKYQGCVEFRKYSTASLYEVDLKHKISSLYTNVSEMTSEIAIELVITCRVINNGVNESLNLVGMLPSTLLLDKRTIQLFSTTFLSTFKVLFEKS